MKIMSVLKNIKNIKGKKVILRLDLNVPIVNGKITNDYKLKSVLPTINLLRQNNCSIIIITHLGEPSWPLNKKAFSSYTVKPLASWLSKKIKLPIKVLDAKWSSINSAVNKLSTGEILMLENIRLFKGELDNSKVLARRLAALGEIYINDAFAVCHREHTSVSAIKNYLPAYAGPLLAAEVNNLETAKHGQKPLLLIMGGAKLSTKLPMIKKLASKASHILVGGGIANTILKSHGLEIGKSLFDKAAAKTYSRLKLANVVMPLDVAVPYQGKRLEKNIKDVTTKDVILDIGSKTINLYSRYIKQAKTIIWNGPLGLFEKTNFSKGTKQIAYLSSKMTSKKVFTLIGGGETVEALQGFKNFSWVSTGGGATLAYLEGKKLPGLRKIVSY